MKNLYFVLISFFCFNLVGLSQVNQLNSPEPTNHSVEKCGSDMLHKQQMLNNPLYLQKASEYEAFVRNFVPSKTAATYVIPVVVHIMETGTAMTAITDQQIQDAIKSLNERLRKVAGGLGDGNGVDVTIEYALAVRDESGNCTNGITRTDMTGNTTYMSDGVTGSGITDASLKSIIRWNTSKYYNMWIISELDGNDGGNGTQGYASFASSHGTASDGAVMVCNSFKNPNSVVLIHELGHSLNLYHTFQGDDANSDGVADQCPANVCGTSGDCCADTPLHARSVLTCVDDSDANACGGGTILAGSYQHNYMDYSDDACQNEFTDNQKTRMLAALAGSRASFFTSNNALVPVTASLVDFQSNKTILCGTGQTVQFYDYSTCSPNTFMAETAWSGISYSWTFTNGGTTYTSTSQNPSITFNVTGSFDVSLELTNGQGTFTDTKTGFIIVSAAPTSACDFSTRTTNEGAYHNNVSNVNFNTIDNATSSTYNVKYTDYSCSQNTIVDAGSTYALSIDLNNGHFGQNEVLEVYIDYNNDGDFVDAGEQVFTESLANNGSSIPETVSKTTNVVIPSSGVTTNTLLRMRVIGEAGTLLATEKTCSANMFIGDVEDYGIYIKSCVVPTVSGNTPASRCGTGTVDLGATASAGIINWYDDLTAGTLQGTGTIFTTPSISTTTTYYAEAVDGSCVSAARTAIVATIDNNCTKTYLGLCGTRYENIGTAVVAYSVPGATMYKFEVVNGGTTQYIERTDRWFYFTQLGSWAYNTDYTIRVAARVGGVYTAFGDACVVSTPYERKIYSTLCGTALSNIGNAITAYTVPGAVKYKFEVVNGGTTQYIERTDRWFYFTQLGSYLFDTPYTIRVASSSDGTNFSAYGPACVVTTPSERRIYVNLCGATLASMGSAVSAYSVGGAVKYKFKVVNGGNTQYIERTSRWFYFTQLGSCAYNTAYDVSVATSSDGTNFSTYGPVCVITTPVSAIAPENDNEITLFDNEFSLEAYPNPSDGDFTISSTHEGTFNIVNELGQLIQKIEITKENNYQTKVEGLDKGVYFVTGVVDGNVVTKKVMVLR